MNPSDPTAVPFGKVRCECGRIVSYLFRQGDDPQPACAECLRKRRQDAREAEEREKAQ